jgi:hypothetical protein
LLKRGESTPRTQKVTSALIGVRAFGPRFRLDLEFGPNERWYFNQVNNFLPHDLVEQVLADRPAVAHRPAEMAPSVGAEAAIVMDFARGGAG